MTISVTRGIVTVRVLVEVIEETTDPEEGPVVMVVSGQGTMVVMV